MAKFNNAEEFKTNSRAWVSKNDNEAESKYKRYYDMDPFPNIPSSLLNSSDIFKYIQKTGMIYPFHPENLKGATYAVKIGATCTYWDEKNQKCEIDLTNDSFTLKRDSIAFVELEPFFRVPNYLILRFNLKVKHAYKGLLLGTGPIVDPGFKGKLYIPLHNLTSNDYIFKGGDELIEMEFTKLSPHSSWYSEAEDGIDGVYIPFPNIKLDRKVDTYISDALKGYLTNKNSDPNALITVVNNSIPVELKKYEEQANLSLAKSEEAQKKSNNALESLEKMKQFGIGAFVIGSLTFLLGFGTAIVNMMSMVDSVNSRIDIIVKSITILEKENESQNNNSEGELLKKIDDLENRNIELNNTIEFLKKKLEESDVQRKEYTNNVKNTY